MGFRNPVTTLADSTARQAAADAQTAAATAQSAANSAISLAHDPLAQIPAGTLPGSKLAADAIDGKTITGALIRTAASGQRVQIDSTNGLVGVNAAGLAVTQVRPSDGVLIAAGATITGTLDTSGSNGAATAGVRVSNVAGNPGQGQVQWYVGSASATATLTGSISGSGGKFYTVGLDGGPSVGLNSEGIPAGGYQPTLRLSAGAGGAIIPDNPLTDLAPLTPLTYPSPTLFGPWNVPASWEDPSCARDATGRVQFAGLVKCLTAGNWSTGAIVAQIPPGFRPARNHFALCPSMQSALMVFLLQIAPTGTVTWQGTVANGASYTANAWVDLSTIHPYVAAS